MVQESGVAIVEHKDPVTVSIAVGAHAEADIAFGTIASNQRVVITGMFIHSTAGAAEVLTIRTKNSNDGGIGIQIPLVITLDSKQFPLMRMQCAWGDLPTRTASAALVSGTIVVTFTWDLETR